MTFSPVGVSDEPAERAVGADLVRSELLANVGVAVIRALRDHPQHVVLPPVIVGDRHRLGRVEVDHPVAEGIEDRRRQPGELHALHDVMLPHPEPVGDLGRRPAAPRQRVERLELVSRMHGLAMIVLGEARLGAVALGIDHAGHQGVAVGEPSAFAPFDQLLDREVAALPRKDLEPVAVDWGHDQRLQDTLGLNVGGKSRHVADSFADIER